MKRITTGQAVIAIFALIGLATLGAGITNAQTRRTVAEARADHNAAVCEAAKQPKGCNQASIPEGGGTIYATDAAFRDGELLPAILSKRTEERNNRASEALNRAFQGLTPAKRVAVCTAAELPDPEVCR